MTLIVEDGSARADAESFISVADADAYHASYGNSAAWDAADTATKEVNLRIASRYMEARFRDRWRGQRVNDSQALSWPRYGVETDDGFIVRSDEVPTGVQQACAELALKSVGGTTLMADLDGGAVKRETIKAGSVEETIEYTGGKREQTSFALAEGLIRPYLWPVGRLRRT